MPRGLEVDFDKLKEVEIIVMGTSAELTELDENEVSVSMNLEGYSRAGTYTKALDVELPEVYSLMQETQVKFKLVRRTSTGSNK